MGYSPAQKGAIDLAKRSLVDSIYTSCKVEGLSTTFTDTQNILDNAPCNYDSKCGSIHIKHARCMEILTG